MTANSQSRLVTTLRYKRDMPGFFPVSKNLVLTGIDSFFPDLTFPDNGITFLYGARNAGDRYIGSLPVADDESLASVEVRVNIGNWITQKIGLDGESSVANTGILNLGTCKMDIINYATALAERALPTGGLDYDDWPKHGTSMPFLASVLHADPLFNHLTMITYKIKHSLAGVFQVATVFKPENIDLSTATGAGLSDCTFSLPAHLQAK